MFITAGPCFYPLLVGLSGRTPWFSPDQPRGPINFFFEEKITYLFISIPNNVVHCSWRKATKTEIWVNTTSTWYKRFMWDRSWSESILHSLMDQNRSFNAINIIFMFFFFTNRNDMTLRCCGQKILHQVIPVPDLTYKKYANFWCKKGGKWRRRGRFSRHPSLRE